MLYALNFPENIVQLSAYTELNPEAVYFYSFEKNTVLNIQCPLNFDLLYATIPLDLVFIYKICTFYKLAEFLINYIIYTYTKLNLYIILLYLADQNSPHVQ